MKTSERPRGSVVIGVGNPLMGDDGLGVAAVQRLRGWRFEPPVEVVDGGTWGMNLLPVIEDAGRVLFLDAIDVGAAPGTAIVLERDEIPRALANNKVSPHQVDVREVLALGELRGTLPDAVAAIGLQPSVVELGTSLSPELDPRLEEMLEAAAARLALWGHRLVSRDEWEGGTGWCPEDSLPVAASTGSTRSVGGGSFGHHRN
jgi:hydrogenase maturation protease